MGIRSGAQAGRWLAILDRLSQSRGGMTIHELAEAFDCTPRTVYRDVAALQERLGAPLVCDKDDGESGTGRWKMMEGSRFKAAVDFTPSELLSLLAAMSLMQPLLETPYGAGLKTLQGKVRGRLSDSAVRFLEEDAALAVAAGARSDFRRHAATIETLRRAIREKRTVSMRYTSLHDGARETTRRLDPYKMWYAEGVLYVVGGCHVHGMEARTFAVDRIRDAAVTEARFQVPEGFRFEEYVRDSFRVFRGETSEVTVEFAPAIAPLIRERVWHESQKIVELPAGAVSLTMRVAGLFEVTQWILSFGAHARAVSPPELVAAVRQEIAKMDEAYRLEPVKKKTARRR